MACFMQMLKPVVYFVQCRKCLKCLDHAPQIRNAVVCDVTIIIIISNCLKISDVNNQFGYNTIVISWWRHTLIFWYFAAMWLLSPIDQSVVNIFSIIIQKYWLNCCCLCWPLLSTTTLTVVMITINILKICWESGWNDWPEIKAICCQWNSSIVETE